MGAGKSTLGKVAARKLGWQFIDLDDEIEQSLGEKIATVFAQSGESYFRQVEREMLEQVVNSLDRPTLLSCGGGTPCYLGNMEWMNKQGITLYLKVPTSILLGRLRMMRDSRPMLSHISNEELPLFIESLLEKREPFYKQAQLIYEEGSTDRNGIAQVIKTAFADAFPDNR